MEKEKRQTTTEWLIEKLHKAEKERSIAIAHARKMEIDNLRLRVKLQSISNFVCNTTLQCVRPKRGTDAAHKNERKQTEEYVEEFYIPKDFPDDECDDDECDEDDSSDVDYPYYDIPDYENPDDEEFE